MPCIHNTNTAERDGRPTFQQPISWMHRQWQKAAQSTGPDGGNGGKCWKSQSGKCQPKGSGDWGKLCMRQSHAEAWDILRFYQLRSVQVLIPIEWLDRLLQPCSTVALRLSSVKKSFRAILLIPDVDIYWAASNPYLEHRNHQQSCEVSAHWSNICLLKRSKINGSRNRRVLI